MPLYVALNYHFFNEILLQIKSKTGKIEGVIYPKFVNKYNIQYWAVSLVIGS